MLPRGYTRVEWIQSTGTQRVNTGIVGRAGIEAEVEFAFTTVPSGAVTILGAFQGTTRIYLPHYSDTFYLGYGAAKNSRKSATAGAMYNIITSLNPGTQTMHINGELAYSGTDAATYTTTLNMYLFALNRDGAALYPASIKLRKCRINYNSAKVRDYIPFITQSNDANLWDDVNLAPAEKVGTFLYGPVLIPAAPANLTQTAEGTTVTLTWDAAEYANHYKIIRDGTELADIDGDVFAYIDTTAEAGAKHTYKVIACNGVQDGGESTVEVQLALLLPQILAAIMTPNPTTINSKITLTVRVEELEIIPQPVWYYSGEIYAGEV